MRYLLALLLCASSVRAQNLEKKTVEVQAPGAPQNMRTLVKFDHNDATIQGAKLSPDGRLAVVYGDNSDAPNMTAHQKRGLLQIWDVATRKRVHDLAGHAEWVTVVFWSPDSKRLVSQSQDGRTLLWDAETGQRVAQLSDIDPGFALRIGGKMTLAQQLRSWLMALGRPQLIGFSRDSSLIYARASRLVLTPAVRKIVERLDTVQPTDEEKAAVMEALRQAVRVLRSWDAATGATGVAIDFDAPVGGTYTSRGRMLTTSALGADNRSLLAIANDIEDQKIVNTRIDKYDLRTGALLSSFKGDEKTRFSLLSDDGRRALASIAGDGKHTQLWDVEAQKPLQVLAGSAATFNNASFSADNRKLLVGGQAGEILIYDLGNGQLERRLSGGHWGGIDSLDMTPDGQTLLSAAFQGNAVQLWDLSAAPTTQLQPQLLIADNNVRQITVAPDGSLWLGWGDFDWGASADARTGKSVELRHISASGEELAKISIPETSGVDQIKFSPDFTLAAGQLSTISRGTEQGAGVGVWDVKAKKLLWRLPGSRFQAHTLAFAPDGKTLASGRSDGAVELWDMASGQLLRQLFQAPSGIETLTFAPDGRLAIGTMGGTIQLLDEQGAVGEELTEDFAPHTILFSPDGKYLLSGGSIVVNSETTGFKVVLRTLADKRIVREWKSEQRYFGGLSFSPDGARVAFSHFSDLARMGRAQTEIWDIASNARVGIVPDYSYGQLPVFAPDGKTLFTVGGGWIKSWNLSDILAVKTP